MAQGRKTTIILDGKETEVIVPDVVVPERKEKVTINGHEVEVIVPGKVTSPLDEPAIKPAPATPLDEKAAKKTRQQAKLQELKDKLAVIMKEKKFVGPMFLVLAFLLLITTGSWIVFGVLAAIGVVLYFNPNFKMGGGATALGGKPAEKSESKSSKESSKESTISGLFGGSSSGKMSNQDKMAALLGKKPSEPSKADKAQMSKEDRLKAMLYGDRK